MYKSYNITVITRDYPWFSHKTWLSTSKPSFFIPLLEQRSHQNPRLSGGFWSSPAGSGFALSPERSQGRSPERCCQPDGDARLSPAKTEGSFWMWMTIVIYIYVIYISIDFMFCNITKKWIKCKRTQMTEYSIIIHWCNYTIMIWTHEMDAHFQDFQGTPLVLSTASLASCNLAISRTTSAGTFGCLNQQLPHPPANQLESLENIPVQRWKTCRPSAFFLYLQFFIQYLQTILDRATAKPSPIPSLFRDSEESWCPNDGQL